MFPKLHTSIYLFFTFLISANAFAGTNPFLAIADAVVSCPSDGSQISTFTLCNYGDTHLVEVNDLAVQSITWQLLDSSSCPPVSDDCPNLSFTCTWNTISTSNSALIDSAGDYRVVLTYENTPNETFYAKSLSISRPWAININKRISALGANDGEMRMIADNPAEFRYQLTNDSGLTFGPFQNSPVFSNLGPGWYHINAQSISGVCEYMMGPIKFGDPDIIAQVTQTGASCIDGGTIEVNATGGLLPYEYSLNGGAFGSNNVFNELIPGLYSVEIRDAVNATLVLSAIAITEANPITADFNSQDVTCNGDQDALIFIDNVLGGNGNYQYQLTGNNGSTGFQSSPYFEGLAPGEYEISVKDSGGCNLVSSITVVEPTPLILDYDTTSASQNNGQDGSITLTASGGWGNYEYSIDGGASFQTSNTFSDLVVGQYEILVSDSFFCLKSINVEVNVSNELSLNAVVQNQMGCGYNARVFLTPTGGTPPYEYKIGTSSYRTTNPFIVGSAGSKTFTVRDANGNTATSNTVTVTVEPTAIKGYAGTSYDCKGVKLPFVQFYMNQAPGNMEYSLYDGIWQSSSTFLDVADGSYVIRAKNEDCEIAFNIEVENVTPVGVRVLEQDGRKVKFQITSGKGPFSYSIDGYSPKVSIGNETIFEVDGFTNGSHWLFVEGADCGDHVTFDLEAFIPELEIHQEVTNSSCFGTSDGSISITGIGGSGFYHYGLTDENNWSIYPITHGNGQFKNLSPGTYRAILRDTKFSQTLRSELITITEPTELSATLLSSRATQINLNDGLVNLLITGGNSPYEYSLDGISFETLIDFSISNLAAGNGTAFIRDFNGCQTEVTFSIDEVAFPNNQNSIVFQNPGRTGVIDVTLTQLPKSQTFFKVYNSKGTIAHSSTIEQGESNTQINVSALSRGIYFIHIKNEEIEEVKKVILI